MNAAQQQKFQSPYRKHVTALRRQGKVERTINSYARAVRRVAEYWDTCPDILTQDQLEAYFSSLVETHSWSTVKVDRNGQIKAMETRAGRFRNKQRFRAAIYFHLGGLQLYPTGDPPMTTHYD